MSEPDPKKSKLSNEARQTFTFTKGNEACDRILLVDDVSFNVHSEILIEHSEYFRIMFTSDFWEKDKKEIEIKEVEVEEMKMFLSALFEPANTAVKDEDVPKLFKMFSFYQAGDYLIHFLEEKQVFKSFPAAILLDLGEEHGIPQINDPAEQFLISQFQKKLPILVKESYVKIQDFKFDDHIIDSSELVSKFGLLKLKETVEARLLAVYTGNKRHPLTIEVKYIELMSKYRLEDLAKDIESYAISLLANVQFTDYAIKIMNRYRKGAEPVKMPKLKETVENICIRSHKTSYSSYHDLLRYVSDYEMTNLKDHIEMVAVAELERNDPRQISLLMESSYSEHLIHNTHGMPKLETAVENFFLRKLKNGGDVDDKVIERSCCHYAKKYHSMDKLKVAIEEFLINKFKNSADVDKIMDKYSKYSILGKYSEYSEECGMLELKKVIEDYLINGFENNHSLKNIKFAFSGENKIYFADFQAAVTNFLKTVSLDDPIMKAGYEHLMALSSDHMSCVLKTILRKPEDEE